MKHALVPVITRSLVLALLFLSAAAVAQAQPWAKDSKQCASWAAQQLKAREYQKLNENFASELQVSLPPAKIREVMAQIESQIGTITSIGAAREKKVRGADGAEVLCQTPNGRLLVQVQFNESKELAGLWVVPGPPQ